MATKKTAAKAPAKKAASAAKSGDDTAKKGRKVFINDEKGKQVARADYIQNAYYKEGKKRGEIVKALKELGHEVPYQIVFASTKDTKEAYEANKKAKAEKAKEREEKKAAAAKAKAEAKDKEEK